MCFLGVCAAVALRSLGPLSPLPHLWRGIAESCEVCLCCCRRSSLHTGTEAGFFLARFQCCRSGIFIPDPNFFHPWSRIHVNEFKYFYPKNCFWALGNMIRVVHPGSGSWFFTHPGYRIQGQKGTGSRIPDPQHWTFLCTSVFFVEEFLNSRFQNVWFVYFSSLFRL